MMLAVVRGIVTRDLLRLARQRGRFIGGLARPLLWVFLVGAGFDAIARPNGVTSYQAYAFGGGIVMAAMFGAMLTGIATVYDREFGMLRLLLASPAGLAPVLLGRALAATAVGSIQGLVVVALAPFVAHVGAEAALRTAVAAVAVSASSATLGLLLASRIRSVESFGGLINTVLFPLLFLSGAFYPARTLPPVLAVLARLNPVTYMVDLVRHALAQPAEFGLANDLLILAVASVAAFGAAVVLFDPERRLIGRRSR
jgi:ABC-2 type transport system permease protein